MKSVLITGITCYIGCELARRLVADGVRVSGIVRKESIVERLLPFQNEVSLYLSDGTQSSLDLALRKSKPDIIIHLAGYYVMDHTPEQGAEMVEANIDFGMRLLESIKKSGTFKIINTGSHFQYYESDHPYPLNFYAQTKQTFANNLSEFSREQGLHFVNLIIYESYGPRDWRKKLFQAIAQNQSSGETMPMVASDPVMDFAHIDDIVDAYIHAAFLLENCPEDVNGQSYALTGGERRHISELIKFFEEIGNKCIITEKKEDLPGVKRVLNPWKGPILPGWRPKVSLRDGIQRFLNGV